jgi:hypothetical protein
LAACKKEKNYGSISRTTKNFALFLAMEEGGAFLAVHTRYSTAQVQQCKITAGAGTFWTLELTVLAINFSAHDSF